MLKKRIYRQKNAQYMIPFIQHSRIGKTILFCGDRNQNRVACDGGDWLKGGSRDLSGWWKYPVLIGGLVMQVHIFGKID